MIRGELVFSMGPTTPTQTFTGTITVPTGIPIGSSSVMRVICKEGGNITPCGTYSYGETEDYSVVFDPPFCGGTAISSFPYSEDFESFSLCATTSGSACVLPASSGWVNQSGDDLDWTVDEDGTTSTGTGPTTDYNPGTTTGNYLYTEATGSGTGYPNKVALLTSPCFDLSSLSNPALSFAYHMYGSDMGSMTVEVNDGTGLEFCLDHEWRPGRYLVHNFGQFVGVFGSNHSSSLQRCHGPQLYF